MDSSSNVKEVVSKIRTLPPERLMPPMAPEHHSAFNIVPKKLSSSVKGLESMDQTEVSSSSMQVNNNMNNQSSERLPHEFSTESSRERKAFDDLVAELKGAKSENESLKSKLDFILTLLTPLQHKQVDSSSSDTGHNDSNVTSLTIALMDDPVQLEYQVNESLRRLKSIRKKETELQREASGNQPRGQPHIRSDPDENIEETLYKLSCEEREERKALAHASDKLRTLKARGLQSATLNASISKEHLGIRNVSPPYWPRRSGLSPEKKS
jgi:hypothetical protein